MAQRNQLKTDHEGVRQNDAFSLFTPLGLDDIRVFPIPTFASSQENPSKLEDLAGLPMKMLDFYKDEVISKGFMSQAEYNEGINELRQWLVRPDSFWLVLSIMTVGSVA